jgi:hypothetical protein
VSEFFAELREHWDDGYWWADRQLLLAILVAVLAGTLELVFVYLKARILRAVAEPA